MIPKFLCSDIYFYTATLNLLLEYLKLIMVVLKLDNCYCGYPHDPICSVITPHMSGVFFGEMTDKLFHVHCKQFGLHLGGWPL